SARATAEADPGALKDVMKGQKRTPTSLSILRGNPGKRPLNLREPRPHALSTECPRELVDPVAQAEWTRAIVPAIAIGQITSADRVLAIMHCQLWATWCSQSAEASAGPHVVEIGARGYKAPNVVRSMSNKTLILLAQIDEKLGFSP